MTLPTRLLSSLLLMLAIAASAASPAAARPLEDLPRNEPVRVVHVPAESGFDWGDAEIGAAAALLGVMLGAGAAFAVTRAWRRPAAPGR